MDEKIVKDSQGLAKDLVNDTISRQAAIEAIKEDKIDLTNTNVVAVFKATGDFEKVETQVMTCDRHIEILKDLPSAQPEDVQKIQDLEQAQFDKIRELAYQDGKADAMAEIIRCRECKLRDTEYCNMARGFMGMKDDDYCSYAERREVSE